MQRKYLVEITKVAERDATSIFAYIVRDNPDAAVKWIEEIERQIDSLETFPERSPIIPESKELGRQYHHLIFGNYRTIFRIQGSKVIIMRVVHGARLLNLEIFEK